MTYKTAYYSLLFPHRRRHTSRDLIPPGTKTLSLTPSPNPHQIRPHPFGEHVQIADGLLDMTGMPEKISRDVLNSRCSWSVNTALAGPRRKDSDCGPQIFKTIDARTSTQRAIGCSIYFVVVAWWVALVLRNRCREKYLLRVVDGPIGEKRKSKVRSTTSSIGPTLRISTSYM